MNDFHIGYLLNAVVYSILGILIFIGTFALVDKLTPYALMVGAMSIGMCVIIAAAVHG
jgi:hypothetical protein